jgi:hypothetical protein
VLLDLSAAFDTIDHAVFLSRLRAENAVSGEVVEWMSSYLSDRHQAVNINTSMSDNIKLKFGFPQGSTIGPFGFKLYTKSLTAIAKKHKINIHLYADDTQLYTSFNPQESEPALARLEACIEEIRNWMDINYLKLNDSKTEFVIFGSPCDLVKVSGWTVTVGDAEIFPSKSARNIGAVMDSNLTMKPHMNNTIRSCYAQLYSISKIRKYLTVDATKIIIHAFISSRMDNLNSLLYKLPDCVINRLQRVQNSAARLIVKLRKRDHITPTLIELHWLPVVSRIDYKILLLIFKCLIGKAPTYLSDLLHQYSPSRSLRSSSQNLLKEHRATKTYGERAFGTCAPKLWNSLPITLRQCKTIPTFKAGLKTFLFKQSYDV